MGVDMSDAKEEAIEMGKEYRYWERETLTQTVEWEDIILPALTKLADESKIKLDTLKRAFFSGMRSRNEAT